MSNYQYANNPSTVLAGSVAAGATSISVASASGFPAYGKFTIIVDSEIMLVTGVSGTTFTVERGFDGSTAATHNNNATVVGILTKHSFLNAHYFDVRAYGAVGDGATDDAAAIQDALDACASTGGTVFLPPGNYKIGSTLTVGSNTTIAGVNLYSSRITVASGANIDWAFRNSDTVGGNVYITLRDLQIDGNKANQTAGGGYGVAFNGVAAGRFERLYIHDTRKGALDFLNGSDIVVSACRLENIGTAGLIDCNGVHLSSTPLSAVIGNTIISCESQGIALLSSNDCRIVGNVIAQSNVECNCRVSASQRVVFAGNVSKDCATNGGVKYGSDSHYGSITGNVFEGNSNNNIEILESSYITVSGNVCRTSANNGILVQSIAGSSATNIVVSNNVCSDNTAAGIAIVNAGVAVSQVTITGNRCVGNDDRGIKLAGVTNIQITGNTLANNGTAGTNRPGIEGFDANGVSCTDVVVSGNRAFDNQGTKTQSWAVLTSGGSDYWCVTGNNLRGNVNVASLALAGVNNVNANNIVG